MPGSVRDVGSLVFKLDQPVDRTTVGVSSESRPRHQKERGKMPSPKRSAAVPRRQIEQALHKSEERFKQVVESAPSAMVMIDRAGTIEMVNAQAERVFGYDRSEILGKPIEILIPDRYRKHHPSLRRLFFEAPQSRPMGAGRDLYGVRSDGSEFPIEIGLNPVETDDGTMVLSAIVDISGRREQSLEASYLAAIVESSGDAIIGKNLDGTITSWNPAAETLFGYPADEAIGRNISFLIPTERLDEEKSILRRIRAGERLSDFETRRRHRDGHEISVSLTVSPICDQRGQVVGASKIVRDITERQLAAETLRLSEERFRSIFDTVAEGVFITDATTGTFAEVNEPGAAMYGYKSEEMIGLDIEAISSGVPPYNQEGARVWIEKAAATGQALQFDWHAKAKNGRLFWAEISLRFAHISGRQVVLAIVRDVTDRRLLESQLRQALKMEAIGTLAGGVAHELNNLLQPIVMMTELVMSELPEHGKQFNQLGRVVDAGLKAKEIVSRILAFGRTDEASHDPLDLSMVVREGVSFIRTIMPTSVSLRVNIEDFVGLVRGDKTQLTQVLINLATNARDAIGANVGTLFVSLSKTNDDFVVPGSDDQSRKPGRYAVLAVEDTGAGMDRETAQRIFEPFFTTKGVGKGTGLGLSVTHGIVTGHGGLIQVKSQPGHGARFSIYLPIENPSTAGLGTTQSIGG
jgi:two-component system cell cycle sensor histidine kinase/response regulator CckA